MPVTLGATPTEVNLNSSAPAIPAGKQAVTFQAGTAYPDPNNGLAQVRDVSAYLPNVGGVDARTTTTETIAAAAQGKLVTLSNASPVAVTLDSAVDSRFLCAVENLG